MTRYVQHVSGQGEKFQVLDVALGAWIVKSKIPITPGEIYQRESLIAPWTIPKSEYVLCEPPEVWRDVTSACHTSGSDWELSLPNGATDYENYRLRKVNIHQGQSTSPGGWWAFIVEQRQP